ncbi:ribosomal protein S18-alanine N-acetyltransferase [Candidatus Finniella inopinata]|uniref:[Ribosomal protein bS18]-alanine N-acetyltransferase n=1 Tax=Candidatus Finniella inopinata TaxID=1696036 RepID=A0A4Q7DFS3_9PROT|nr:ribosomal protein S18-alanine N-acetyltransferase [Candidatus Finniella inopinata]RZI45661.1 ribosomal-protein-alanine N-acetyltransferase [Candidatus Finniella inopinata]
MLKNASLSPLHLAHAPLLAQIHRECFDKPWSETFFANLLSEQQTACPVAGWLAVSDEQPAGFILARNQITQAEILTFAVRSCLQRQGIGETLLKTLQQNTPLPIFLEVAVDNQAAISLYAKHGFKTVGNRPGYYTNAHGAVLDACVMQYP